MTRSIVVRDACEHNLKHVSLTIPRDSIVVVTGVSGSGKSSLAFDTIFEEGQRRYVDSLSAYARQFIGVMKRPDVQSVTGISPTISIDQKTVNRNPRSTVGTTVEVLDFFRLLFARLGTPHCPKCGKVIQAQTVDQIVDNLYVDHRGRNLIVLAPIVQERKGEYRKELAELAEKGFARVRVDGKILRTNEKQMSENDNFNSIKIKSVKVPFLSPFKNDENYILTIILDLDGTLIYDQNIEVNYEEEEEEEDDEDNKHQKNNDIILRPRILEFLDKLLELKCELIIFTSSVKQRADEVINIIEKNKRYFNGRLYREHCTLMGAAYVKDISKLGRNLSKTIIIDNDLGCFYLQQENGILIKSFEGKEDDNKLLNLHQILNQIIKSPFNDIRVELDKYRDELNNLVAN